jgi:two-component system sensor histidine kinase ArlS
MPVRLKITLFFVTLAILLLVIVCGSIYYFSYTARINNIKLRLKNRALTTARLLAQEETFDPSIIHRIDSLTTISLVNKTVEAYNYQDQKIYNYSDVPGDTFKVSPETLNTARVNGSYYFTIKNKEVIAYYYSDPNKRIVVISAAEDIEGKKNLNNLLKILLVSFSFGTAFILLAGYLFSIRLLHPIKKISADVAEISAQNLARRIIVTGPSTDEWHQLGTTLNDLLNRLQESFDLQRRFIANASHELSTPLTSISSQLEVSLQKERNAEEYRAVMQSIYQDVVHMSKLTLTLLEVAKASENTGGFGISLVRIDEVLLRIPAELTKISPGYSVSLKFEDLPEDEKKLLVFGNEALLFTAIKNIVINACKYSEDHKAVVGLYASDKQITIIVIDKGRGIEEHELKNIFQPFYRAQENSIGAGFGLGLSLADKIIKLHKGNIEVSSVKNAGSRFTIQLPSYEHTSVKS